MKLSIIFYITILVLTLQGCKSTNNQELTYQSTVLNIDETASYLKMSVEDLEAIILIEAKYRNERSVYSGVFLQYFTVNDVYYFHKPGLELWLQDISKRRAEYNTSKNYMLR